MKTKLVCLALVLALIAALTTGCSAPTNTPVSSAPTSAPAEPVTLIVAGAWDDCKAIETVGQRFTELYPNCSVHYEYLQDFTTSILKRVTGENAVDLFFTSNIQPDSEMLPYALELFGCEELDLSSTFDGLITNFTFIGATDSDEPSLYAIPLGAEIRGLYVNKTLLDSLGIAIPTNQESLLAACETLKQNGYIAFHGNPGNFAQTLLYPWVCNLIANAPDPQAAYDMVNSRADGLGEMLYEPFAFLYTLIENGYYDYKTAQTEHSLFTDVSDLGYSRDFLNIRLNGEVWEKADDVGMVAFLPQPLSLMRTINKTSEDYHSEIEYVFMPAPVGENGGFAYLSPARGIAANKNSANLEWSIRFLDFLFTPEINELFAQEFGIIPNTKGAFEYISTLYDIPSEQISHLGQVTFDYGFYGIITDALLNVSKGNNPKYMQVDEAGTATLYPLSYYIDAFEQAIQDVEQ